MNEPKYPDDFKGWKPLYPILNNRYLVLESPDGSKEASIHLEDNEGVGIKDAHTGEDLYEHPRNAIVKLILSSTLLKKQR